MFLFRKKIQLNLFVRNFKKLLSNNLIVGAGQIGVSSILSRGALFYRDFLLALSLGPSVFGSWTQLIILLNYTLHLPIGFQHVLSRDVPYSIGKNDDISVNKIQSLTLSISLLSTTLFTLLLFFLNDIFFVKRIEITSEILLCFVFLVFIQQIYSFFSILLRAHQEFTKFSIGYAFLPILNVCFLFIFYNQLSLYHSLLSFCLSYALIVIYWLWRSPFNFKAYISNIPNFKIDFRNNYKNALPLFLSGILGMMILSMDRFIISFFYSSNRIGIYSFAFMITQAISFVVSPIYQVIYPKLMNSLGCDKNDIKDFFFFLIFSIPMIVILMTSFIFFYLDDFIFLYIKQYLNSVWYIKALLISSIFFVISNGANTISNAIFDQKTVIKLQFIISILQIVIISFISMFNFDLIFVALVMIITSILYSVLSVYFSGIKIITIKSFITRIICPVYVFFIATLGSMFIIDMLIEYYFKSTFFTSIFGHLIWLLLFIGSIRLLNKRLGLAGININYDFLN